MMWIGIAIVAAVAIALALALGVLYLIQGVRFWRVASQLAAR